MRPITLIVLAAAAAAAVGTAAVRIAERAPATGIARGAPLLPGFAAQIDAVVRIEVGRGADRTVLVRKDGAWTAPDKFDAAAKTEQVSQLLAALAEMETVERKTARPDLHARLQLEDPTGAEAKSVRVAAKDAGGAVLAEIVLGKRRTAGGAYAPGALPMYYVRRAGEAQTWLVQTQATLDVRPQLTEWLQRDIVDIRADRVAAVRFEDPDGAAFELARKDGETGDFALRDLPEGRQAKEAFELNLPASLLDLVQYDDLLPAAQLPADAKPARIVTVTLKDGVVATLSQYQVGDKPWTRIAFAGAPAADDAKAELARLQANTAPWLYLLPEFKRQRILLKRDDLLQPPTPAG